MQDTMCADLTHMLSVVSVHTLHTDKPQMVYHGHTHNTYPHISRTLIFDNSTEAVKNCPCINAHALIGPHGVSHHNDWYDYAYLQPRVDRTANAEQMLDRRASFCEVSDGSW